ncbi:hypothetical protein MASR2M48_35100 [Spirochaetota bacterium]
MNERKTEQYVRDCLDKLGYDRENFFVEEQQSDNPIINKLLKKCFKKR